MMRLIDADGLITILIDRDYIKTSRQEDNARKLLNLAPTVEERKKGRWESIKSYPNIIFCNECGTAFMRDSTIWNFCPDCGADMRGEEE